MKAIILAAGMASRLRPLTLHTPKSLLTIDGKSLLQRSMDALIQNGIKDFVIVTGYLHEKIEAFVKEQYADTISVKFIYNNVYGGHTFFKARAAKNENFGPEVGYL